MCNFKIWSRTNEDVYVMQCTECNTYQIRVRHLCIMQDGDHYQTFRETIINAYEALQSGENEMFVIPTFKQEMRLLLSRSELKNLYELLDLADTEMQAAQLASMFY